MTALNNEFYSSCRASAVCCSDDVQDSHLVQYSHRIVTSDQVFFGCGLTNCKGMEHCEGCNASSNCSYCHDCHFCDSLRFAEHCLFCHDPVQVLLKDLDLEENVANTLEGASRDVYRYVAFNRLVGRERYREIEVLLTKIFGQHISCVSPETVSPKHIFKLTTVIPEARGQKVMLKKLSTVGTLSL